jgi:hypothetical protein
VVPTKYLRRIQLNDPTKILSMASLVMMILGLLGFILSFMGNKVIAERRFKIALLFIAGAVFYVLANRALWLPYLK